MKKYFVNPDNVPTYINAQWVQITGGKLQFRTGAETVVAEYKIHEGLHFDDIESATEIQRREIETYYKLGGIIDYKWKTEPNWHVYNAESPPSFNYKDFEYRVSKVIFIHEVNK